MAVPTPDPQEGSAGFRKATEADLVLVKPGIDRGDLQEMLDRAAGKARRSLRDEGRDARIVSEVYLVVEAEIAESFEATARTGGEVVAELTGAFDELDVEPEPSTRMVLRQAAARRAG